MYYVITHNNHNNYDIKVISMYIVFVYKLYKTKIIKSPGTEILI